MSEQFARSNYTWPEGTIDSGPGFTANQFCAGGGDHREGTRALWINHDQPQGDAQKKLPAYYECCHLETIGDRN